MAWYDQFSAPQPKTEEDDSSGKKPAPQSQSGFQSNPFATAGGKEQAAPIDVNGGGNAEDTEAKLQALQNLRAMYI
jgi:hypothetical protein